jgi:hypothetical protein
MQVTALVAFRGEIGRVRGGGKGRQRPVGVEGNGCEAENPEVRLG